MFKVTDQKEHVRYGWYAPTTQLQRSTSIRANGSQTTTGTKAKRNL